MTFDEVMAEITNGLTGDPEKDLRFLNEKSEEYKDHENGPEILRACGRLIYERMPKNDRNDLDEILRKIESHIASELKNAMEQVSQKKPEKALEILERLLGKISALNSPHEDEQSIFVSLDDPLQEFLYHNLYQPKKTIRQPALAAGPAYYYYGYVLFETGQHDKAEKALEEARTWCPMNSDYAFEHIETFKARGNLETFRELTLAEMKKIYIARNLARGYRNLGYYYVEKKDYPTAVMLYQMSHLFDNQSEKYVEQELNYISQTSGQKIKFYSPEEIQTAFTKKGIPLGVDPTVLQLIVSFGSWCLENKHISAAKACLQIFYDVTNDEEVKKIIDSLPDEPEGK